MQSENTSASVYGNAIPHQALDCAKRLILVAASP
jgi:hypothetical protein